MRRKDDHKGIGSLRRILAALFAFALVAAFVPGCDGSQASEAVQSPAKQTAQQAVATHSTSPTIDLADIPPYDGNPYVVINDNEPTFTQEELEYACFEEYAALDDLGRCGVAFAHICKEVMPTVPRDDISEVKPTGWHYDKYDFIDGLNLYNRCHLIGFQLAGENANARNLITGTRYMNAEGMLPFEIEVADYVKATGNSVLFRVTPVYEGNNLVASGVQMEALSVEDDGEGVRFNVFCYNVQPGVAIDYATGDHHLDGTHRDASSEIAGGIPDATTGGSNSNSASATQGNAHHSESDGHHDTANVTYVANTKSMKFHKPNCPSVEKIASYNRYDYSGSRDELVNAGYVPCKSCNP